MKENKEFNLKILRSEVFAVKSPKKIVVGDPHYIETVPQENLKELMVKSKRLELLRFLWLLEQRLIFI